MGAGGEAAAHVFPILGPTPTPCWDELRAPHVSEPLGLETQTWA